MLLACLTIAVHVAHLIGRADARTRGGFLVLPGDNATGETDWVVLRIYGDKVVCAPLQFPAGSAAANVVYSRQKV
jgi:hypothetical protein